MNELTAEWIDKAEGDYATANRERRARQRPNFDVRYRYPGEAADKDEARAAFQDLKVVRAFIRERLGLHE